jgi:hypothetical protein
MIPRLHAILFTVHSRPLVYFLRAKPCLAFQSYRRFATHRDALPSSLLNAALDQQQQRGAQRDGSVGPFQLGIQPSFRQGEKVKKWSELTTTGKGMTEFILRHSVCDTFDSHQISVAINKFRCYIAWRWIFRNVDLCPDIRALLEQFTYRVIRQGL